MYILAINGSPRGRKSNTDKILQAFLRGAESVNAKTETIYLSELKIIPCRGCFNCWTKTPGKCIFNDDMNKILPKIRLGDVVVYATPLYTFTVSGIMKNFLDRLLPNLDPHIVKRGNHYIHPSRYKDGVSRQKVVLISNCGFPERHHFTGLVETFKRFTDNPDEELVGTILCAGGELLSQEVLKESLQWYLDASYKAGKEIVLYGRILEETQKILDTPLADPETYSNMANLWWNSQIADENIQKEIPINNEEELSEPIVLGDTVKEASDKPKSVKEAILGMPLVFNKEAGKNLVADIQFIVTGEEAGNFVLRIRNGTCTAHIGKVKNPTLTIKTPSETWLKIARGELSGQKAYVQGLYKVEGDFNLLLKLGELFSSSEKPKEVLSSEKPKESKTAKEKVKLKDPLKIPGMAWLTIAFIPWIVFWATVDIPNISVFISVGIPLILSSLILLYRIIFLEPTWMDIGTPIYFAISFVTTLLGNKFFIEYGNVVSYIALASIWLGTMAKDTPLTSEYSKWSYPEAIWSLPVFKKTNAIITTVWGWTYLLMAVISLMGKSMGEYKLTFIIIRNLLLIPSFIFTIWFQKWYPSKE